MKLIFTALAPSDAIYESIKRIHRRDNLSRGCVRRYIESQLACLMTLSIELSVLPAISSRFEEGIRLFYMHPSCQADIVYCTC